MDLTDATIRSTFKERFGGDLTNQEVALLRHFALDKELMNATRESLHFWGSRKTAVGDRSVRQRLLLMLGWGWASKEPSSDQGLQDQAHRQRSSR